MVGRKTRRALAAGLVTLAAVAGGVTSQAQAAESAVISPNCNNYIPDGVGGITVYVAGKPVRIAKYEDLNVCIQQDAVRVDDGALHLNGGCGTGCFDLFAPVGTGTGSYSAMVCWTADGSRVCTGATQPGYLNPVQPCLISYGQPAQQTPSSCLVVIDKDTLLAGVTG